MARNNNVSDADNLRFFTDRGGGGGETHLLLMLARQREHRDRGRTWKPSRKQRKVEKTARKILRVAQHATQPMRTAPVGGRGLPAPRRPDAVSTTRRQDNRHARRNTCDRMHTLTNRLH